MDVTRFNLMLSHTAWGMLPVATSVCLGIVVYRLRQIYRTTRSLGALFALILSWALLILSVWLCLAAILHIRCATVKARQAQCISNVRRLSIAMMMYAQDYDERFPPAGQWGVLLQRYEKEKLVCPEVKTPISYGMNNAMDETLLSGLGSPAETVLLFEAEVLIGGYTDQKLIRHSGGSIVGFTDGHAKWVNPQTKLKWLVGSRDSSGDK